METLPLLREESNPCSTHLSTEILKRQPQPTAEAKATRYPSSSDITCRSSYRRQPLCNRCTSSSRGIED
jgi:hypothetical protein